MSKPTIQAIDNFFPEEISRWVTWFCEEYSRYRYGEYDDRDGDPADPTGLVHDVFNIEKPEFASDKDEQLYSTFKTYIEKHYPGFFNKYIIYRVYVNCFAPRENAYFHNDCCEESDQMTFIYYPKSSLWEYAIAEGGWTEFFFEDEKKIMGVVPYPNSISMFTSRLLHRATPFKSHHRFSIAVKTINKDEAPEFCD